MERSPYQIKLSDTERQELEKRARNQTAEYREVVRARIVLYAAEGFSNQEIADQLFLSVRTVENHRFNIMQKLDTKNAAALVQEAMKRGLAD